MFVQVSYVEIPSVGQTVFISCTVLKAGIDASKNRENKKKIHEKNIICHFNAKGGN